MYSIHQSQKSTKNIQVFIFDVNQIFNLVLAR